MALMNWKDDFETGIDYLDDEHRRLVALVNEACESMGGDAPESVVADCLGRLYTQINAHFALEERLMRERKYAAYDKHKVEHEALLEEIRYMMEAYERGACETCGMTPDECLTAWLYKHFQAQDTRLGTAPA